MGESYRVVHADAERSTWRTRRTIRSDWSGDEVETSISDARIPADRQIVYALELLAGVRPGKAAALHWRPYDPTVIPLGKILVAKSYNTQGNVEKTTKTDAVKHIPVHPVPTAMLAQWKLEGWPEMMGRAPGPDDLIVPLPPDAESRRRARHGKPYRPNDYSGTRWRDKDLPALGWQHRRHCDMRATFITLAIEDGADPDVIETRVTHSRKAPNRVRRLQPRAALGANVQRDLEASDHARTAKLGDRATFPAGGGHKPLPFAEVAASV